MNCLSRRSAKIGCDEMEEEKDDLLADMIRMQVNQKVWKILLPAMIAALPVLFILLLPGVIFGGYSPYENDILNNNEKIMENMAGINKSIAEVMQEAYDSCLEKVEKARADEEYSEVIDTVQGQIIYQANQIISQYCASQSKNYDEINIDHLRTTLQRKGDKIYYYSVHHERRTVGEGESAHTIVVAVYTIYYVGEEYWAEKVFALSEEQTAIANDYAANLTIFLYEHKTAVANGTHKWIAEQLQNDHQSYAGGSWGSPFPSLNWREHISSGFGQRPTPGGKGGISNHTGVDIALPKGTPISALNDGVVLYTKYSNTGYGYHVVINHHGGYATLYGHCSELLVSAGQTVKKGQVIAKVGTTGNSTGYHLHVEIIENGQPLNPAEYLP